MKSIKNHFATRSVNHKWMSSIAIFSSSFLCCYLSPYDKSVIKHFIDNARTFSQHAFDLDINTLKLFSGQHLASCIEGPHGDNFICSLHLICGHVMPWGLLELIHAQTYHFFLFFCVIVSSRATNFFLRKGAHTGTICMLRFDGHDKRPNSVMTCTSRCVHISLSLSLSSLFVL